MTAMNGTVSDTLIDTEAQSALNVPETPAYVYSESLLKTAASNARAAASFAGCRLLYTLKPCGLVAVVETISPYVDGLAASSVFETILASEVIRADQTLHCYSPAFSGPEMGKVLSTVDYLSVNSMTQFELALGSNRGAASLGLRLNPQIGFAADDRYDPCRPHSKLGVPLSDFAKLVSASGVSGSIDGIHVHNNCESDDLSELATTAETVGSAARYLDRLDWVNLGGGYYLDRDVDRETLAHVVSWLVSEFGVTVFIEPGTGLVQQAGMIVSEVLDVFDNDGKDIAVLDASTSHMPEVFEYGFTPEIRGCGNRGNHQTILAGRSCLAGDVFGDYRLFEPLRTGDRIAIMDAGAYSHSRSAPFNGIPVPSSYLQRSDGAFVNLAAFGYREFASRNGVAAVAPA